MPWVTKNQVQYWRTFDYNVNRAKYKAKHNDKPVFVVRMSENSWDTRLTMNGIRGREYHVVHPDGRVVLGHSFPVEGAPN